MSALTSVKISSVLADAARTVGPNNNRSIGGQVDYWAKLGRAFEASQTGKIAAALEGRLDSSQLSDEEYAIYDAELVRLISDGGPNSEAFWADVGDRGGTGLDETGEIVRGIGGGKSEKFE